MESLRKAALAALAALPDRAVGNTTIERVSVDVARNGEREMVTLQCRGAELRWSCTCGQQDCPHAATALHMVAAGDTRVIRPGSTPGLPPSSPDVRTVLHSDQPDQANHPVIADVLADLVTSVVRAGLDTPDGASVAEAIERLSQAVPTPMPLGVSRWIGRLREAVSAKDAAATTRVLDGATRLVQDLAERAPDDDARRRTVSWLGALSSDQHSVERLSDRTMVEVAREWLNGVDRGAVERRYLVDLGDGTIYREDRARGGTSASLGPCPRMVSVGLAEVELSAQPCRIRLLQYSTSLKVPKLVWQQLSDLGARDFRELLADYRAAVGAYPGLAEPFALVSPDRHHRDPSLEIVDDKGCPLHLCLDEGAAALDPFDDVDDSIWVAGRLIDEDGMLKLKPLSVGAFRDGQVRFQRM